MTVMIDEGGFNGQITLHCNLLGTEPCRAVHDVAWLPGWCFGTASALPIDHASPSSTQASLGATDSHGGSHLDRSFALRSPPGARSAPCRALGAGRGPVILGVKLGVARSPVAPVHRERILASCFRQLWCQFIVDSPGVTVSYDRYTPVFPATVAEATYPFPETPLMALHGP